MPTAVKEGRPPLRPHPIENSLRKRARSTTPGDLRGRFAGWSHQRGRTRGGKTRRRAVELDYEYFMLRMGSTAVHTTERSGDRQISVARRDVPNHDRISAAALDPIEYVPEIWRVWKRSSAHH